MHLEQQLRLRVFFIQRLLHPDHSQLDQVRRGALNGGIQRNALRALANVEVAAFQLRDIPAAAVERGGIARLPCLGHHALHIVPDAVIGSQVIVDILPRLVAADADVLGQGEF